LTDLSKGTVVNILPSMAKALQGLFCSSNCIHHCPDSKYSFEFVVLVARWT